MASTFLDKFREDLELIYAKVSSRSYYTVHRMTRFWFSDTNCIPHVSSMPDLQQMQQCNSRRAKISMIWKFRAGSNMNCLTVINIVNCDKQESNDHHIFNSRITVAYCCRCCNLIGFYKMIANLGCTPWAPTITSQKSPHRNLTFRVKAAHWFKVYACFPLYVGIRIFHSLPERSETKIQSAHKIQKTTSFETSFS